MRTFRLGYTALFSKHLQALASTPWKWRRSKRENWPLSLSKGPKNRIYCFGVFALTEYE